MGLKFSRDLEAWTEWHRRRHWVLSVVRKMRHPDTQEGGYRVSCSKSGPGKAVVVLDSANVSSVASLVAPLYHLEDFPVTVIVPETFPEGLLPDSFAWCQPRPMDELIGSHSMVLASGHYLSLGASAYQACQTALARFVTVQHGLVTPLAPPLPPDCELLAWSDADADFWRSGRRDVQTHVVGSQLLSYASSQIQTSHVSRFLPPVYLGQLHGAELPRWGMARAVTRFCRAEGARYRPHPSEIDKASRLQHAVWRRMGIGIDDDRKPLALINRPVVAAFSTGVLEAAARGVPSWVFYPNPPRWLQEFWERYGMRQWGGEPTAPLAQPEKPALAVAHFVKNSLSR